MKQKGRRFQLMFCFIVSLLICVALAPMQADAATDTYFSVTVEQAKMNYREIKITVPDADYLHNNDKADTVRVTINKNYIYGNDKISDTVTKTVKTSTLVRNKTFKMEVEDFGKHYATIEFLKDGEVVNKIMDMKVGVVAEEYNIASINATYPVTLFTLQLWDITEKEDGTPVPTIVNLYRAEHWNWDKLPENVYAQPNLTDEQTKSRIQYATKYRRMADYIGELVELNPDAKFNLYINDGYYKLILQLLCANGVPEENYKVYLLSDGSGSYDRYSKTFNVKDPQAKYDEMAAGWEKAKAYCYENGEMNLDILPYNGYFTYDYVITNEDENTEWWVGRFNKADNLFVTPNEEFNEKFFQCTRIKATGMNTYLQKIQNKGEAATTEFKTLFNFSETMFEEAETTGKTAMVFLGTRLTNEQEAKHFASYARFSVAYYGDKYVYYYKGHPATPTSQYPERIKLLDNLGITDIESSIAAELIFFFNPEVHLSGFDSTTFQSVKNDQIGGYFNVTESAATAESANPWLKEGEFFMTYLGLGSEISNEYAAICTTADHAYYLAEFGTGYDSEYDLAIWDDNASTISFYKKAEDGKLTLVSSRDAMDDQTISAKNISGVAGKTYPIGATAKTKLSYASTNEKIATVDENGNVKLVGVGTCKIRITAAASVSYKSAETEITVTVKPDKVTMKPLITGNKKVSVQWNAVKSADAYKVYRSADGGKTYKLVKTVTTLKYNDDTVAAGSKYYYKVAAGYKGTFGTASSAKTIIASKKLAKPVLSSLKATNGKVTIKWKKVANATKYQIYRSNDNGKTYKRIYTTKKLSYTSSPTTAKQYKYKVRAIQNGFYGEFSSSKLVTSLAKTKITTLKSPYKGKVTIKWNKVKFAQKYTVWKSTNGGKTFNKVYTTKKTTLRLKDQKAGKTQYKVRAVRGNNYSKFSAVKTITVK